MSGLRHRVRVTALQVLFEIDVADHSLDAVLERRLSDEPWGSEAGAFLSHLVYGVWEHRYFLDEVIGQAAPSWPVAQMPAVDKAILRIALFELLKDDVEKTPARAVINEAVELAKMFGSDNSSRFVNGVLGSVMSQHK
jgi:transcription antitermination protein NusB